MFLFCSAIGSFSFSGQILTSGLISVANAQAPGLQASVDALPTVPGLTTQDPRVFVARVIKGFLGLLGIIAVILVLYGGYLYMTSAGNPERINLAKKVITNAGIGLAIILASYGIVTFIFSYILGVNSGGADFNGSGGGDFSGSISSSLGAGVIESHYPSRNAINIPRNTKIVITFKEKMLLSSLIKPSQADPAVNLLNGSNIFIHKTSDPLASGPFVTNVKAFYTLDQKTFVFAPIELLGSSSDNVSYTITLGSGIKKSNGDAAFGSLGSYTWEFEVGTVVDNTPPHVSSVIPIANSSNARNVIVQINFNEPVDPISASGSVTADNFKNILLKTAANQTPIEGTYSISNGYQTVEFVTTQKCGVNSCGNNVFCLPASAQLTALIKSAALSSEPPKAIFPYSGVVDLAGNSFDGNKDNKVDGVLNDDYQWSFSTTNEIDLTPPVVIATVPGAVGNVLPDAPVSITFSKLMSSSSLNSSNLILPNVNYWISSNNNAGKTTVVINHDSFATSTNYTPAVTSGARDVYQNCYNPCIGP